MTKPRVPVAKSNKEKGLERKLAAYTVASGAFLAISATGSAQAGIVYSGPQDIQVPVGSAPFFIDFDGDSAADFAIANKASGPGNLLISAASAGIVSTNSPFADALSLGTPISGSSPFKGYTVMGGVVPGDPTQDFGPWADAQNQYLGVSFTAGDSLTHYAWVEVSFPSTGPNAGTATVEGWAYETDPGVGINAGAVPEPSTLALSLLALGSVGVAALHRSRKKVQQPSAA